MKKTILTIIITLLVVSAGYVLLTGEAVLGGGGTGEINSINSLTSYTTSTGSYTGTEPIKLLDKDQFRRYAVITNISDTTVYLYATTTALDYTGTGAARYASGTVTVLNGIPLVANASFTIEPDNRIYGHIYASSTLGATKKAINISYK